MIVKKYSNRRLYDTEDSRYITLEELAEKIRAGADVRVVDAKTGGDLTQQTLVQLILEGETARLLPVSLLVQLVRMRDDAIAEFFSKYVTAALEMYLAAKDGVRQVSPYLPFSQVPMDATNAMFRWLSGQVPFGNPPQPPAPPAPPAGPSAGQPASDADVEDLRREVEALKRQMKDRSD